VSVGVSNTGSMSGDQIMFLWVQGPPTLDGLRSQKELKAFARVSLEPGESKQVELPLRVQDLKHWSTSKGSWVIDPGEYMLFVGPSAADYEGTGQFTVPG